MVNRHFAQCIVASFAQRHQNQPLPVARVLPAPRGELAARAERSRCGRRSAPAACDDAVALGRKLAHKLGANAPAPCRYKECKIRDAVIHRADRQMA